MLTRRNPGAVAVLVAVVLALGYYAVYLGPLPFVESWWARSNYMDPYHKRHRIADGLLLSGSLVGKSRKEIVALLGEPPQTDYFSNWHLVYQLGNERSWLAVDSEWLVLRFGAEGAVSEAAVVRD